MYLSSVATLSIVSHFRKVKFSTTSFCNYIFMLYDIFLKGYIHLLEVRMEN